MLHRFPKGVDGKKVHQKRVPAGAPPWVETVRLHFPRYGQHADELCVTELAQVIWAVQMSTVEFHPWNSRRPDVEQPDEWRIDLDPMPECPLDDGRGGSRTSPTRCSTSSARSAGRRRRAGTASTSTSASSRPTGSSDVRRAALAFAREVERRAPDLVTTTWWRKDRDPAAVFVDYNQNARDHTIAAAYSVRGVPDATVSAPITWDEVDDVEPGDFTMATVPPASPSWATSTPASTTPCSPSTSCSSGPTATSATARSTTAHPTTTTTPPPSPPDPVPRSLSPRLPFFVKFASHAVESSTKNGCQGLGSGFERPAHRGDQCRAARPGWSLGPGRTSDP